MSKKRKKGRVKVKTIIQIAKEKAKTLICSNSNRDESWETTIDIVKDCSKGPKEITVLLNPLAKVKIDALMEKYKTREWLAYLLGDRGNFLIRDIIIPEQTATAASVTDISLDGYNTLPIIGVIHSHHNMGTSFSGTDDTWINQNHDISVLVSHSSIKGRVRYTVPCGAVFITDADIRLNMDIAFDKRDFLKEAEEKIQYPAPITMYNGYYGGGYSPGYNISDKKPVNVINSLSSDELRIKKEIQYNTFVFVSDPPVDNLKEIIVKYGGYVSDAVRMFNCVVLCEDKEEDSIKLKRAREYTHVKIMTYKEFLDLLGFEFDKEEKDNSGVEEIDFEEDTLNTLQKELERLNDFELSSGIVSDDSVSDTIVKEDIPTNQSVEWDVDDEWNTGNNIFGLPV